MSMKKVSNVLLQDIDDIVQRLDAKWTNFQGKTVLITGSTGLIGSLLTRVFLSLNENYRANIKIVLLVRSKERIKELLGGVIPKSIKVYIQDDITQSVDVMEDVNYIIHTASPTNSKYYVERPVETLGAIINGSKCILELAKTKNVSKIVLMSSMEAYGSCGESKVIEADQGYINLENVRSSYPIGKRTAEFLSYAFYKEYNVPAISVRLAMCFGAGQKMDDPRVYKVFCDEAMNGHDVIIKSTGKSVINFVYSADAILAIILLLIDGGVGETYNVAGESLGYTINDMAKYIADENRVSIKHCIESREGVRFAPDDLMILNTNKILKIGWKPKYNIEEALRRYMDYLASFDNTMS